MKLAAKILAVFAIGAASASVAHAGWEPIDDTRSWNTERVQTTGSDRTVFIRETKSGKSPKGKRYTSIVTAHTISCWSSSISLKSIAFFDSKGNRVDGAELHGQNQTIYPDTVADQLAQTVCPRSNSSTARHSELAHLQELAGGRAQSGVDTLAYADRIRRRVAPNLMLDHAVEGNPSAVVTVRMAQDGSLLSVQLTKSSGDTVWDSAVLRAIERSSPLPRGEDGKAPSELTMTFRPGD